MAYDEDLANRLREVLGVTPGLSEKAMFGGLAFLVNGHMAVAASSKGGLLLRCEPADTERLLKPPHVGRFEMRGKEMDGWLRVDAAAISTKRDLTRWVGKGVAYAASLPPKSHRA
jgi:TfoX/Sxy family transcriptional regulator of competence genes